MYHGGGDDKYSYLGLHTIFMHDGVHSGQHFKVVKS